MADSLKVLGQAAPGATTLTPLYTVPAATSAVISSVYVCNRSATGTSFRISVAQGGAADANAQYLYFDMPIQGNDTMEATVGLTLATTDVLRCYATLATLSFQAF